jgi:hypothetical protein
MFFWMECACLKLYLTNCVSWSCREDSLADKRDNDLDVDEESTDIEETGSRSSGRAGVFQGLEAATAEANRRHIQGQLRNSVFR